MKLICLLPSGSKDELVKASLQGGINEVFDQVTVDPRLETFEQREREKRLADLGFTREFIESRLDQKIFSAKEARNA